MSVRKETIDVCVCVCAATMKSNGTQLMTKLIEAVTPLGADKAAVSLCVFVGVCHVWPYKKHDRLSLMSSAHTLFHGETGRGKRIGWKENVKESWRKREKGREIDSERQTKRTCMSVKS